MEKTHPDYSVIVSEFLIEGSFQTATPHGSGHIHDTYHIRNAMPGCPDYLLQRVNHLVFKNVPALMENIQLVTAHIRKKLLAIPGADPARETLTLIPTQEGKYYYTDAAGNFWRLFLFIPEAHSYDIVSTPEQAYQGGKMFGKFNALLSDLSTSQLHESIPDFHHVEKRLQKFDTVVQKDPAGRVNEVLSEISFVKERAHEMSLINRMGREGKMPLRVTHNDTKFNNVLLDKNDNGLCVIDLDTVMPGYALYDFGDSIRTTISTADEDEKDLQKIGINLRLFEAYTKGYLQETISFLQPIEIDYLAFGSKLLTFIMGLRFLTDYIEGDVYYKIHFPLQNLQRARAQFQLLRCLEENYTELQAIVQRLAAESKAAL